MAFWAPYYLPDDVIGKIGELNNANFVLTNIVFSPNGGWLLLLENGYWYNSAFPAQVGDKVRDFITAGKVVSNVVFSPDRSGWLIINEDGWIENNFPTDAVNKLTELQNAGLKVNDFTFVPGNVGWIIVLENGLWYNDGFPSDCADKIKELNDAGFRLKHVTFSANGGWLLTVENGWYANGSFPGEVFDQISNLNSFGFVLENVVMSPAGGALTVLRGDPHQPLLQLSTADIWYDEDVNVNVRIQISDRAPAGGLQISLTSDNTRALTGGTVTIQEGGQFAQVTLHSGQNSGSVNLTGSNPGHSSRSLPLIVLTVTQTAPSAVDFPDIPKHFPVHDISFGRRITSSTGLSGTSASLQLVEVRGWLRSVANTYNPSDPDWHFDFEIDPDWIDQLALDAGSLHKVLRLGNALCMLYDPARKRMEPIYSSPNKWVVAGVPCLHVELNGWESPGYIGHFFPGRPVPSDWVQIGQPHWPYNPLRPDARLQLNDLAADMYVRVVGSLVTDEPHYVDEDVTSRLAKKAWARDTVPENTSFEPTNAARWAEIHSPDVILPLPDKLQNARYYSVAVAADNGLTHGDTASMDIDLAPPGPPPAPTATVAIEEMVRSDTNFRTITEGNAAKSGAAISCFSDHVHIHVSVKGEGAFGAKGKFAALYKVWWKLPG